MQIGAPRETGRDHSLYVFIGLALLSAIVSAVSSELPGGATVKLPMGVDLIPVWPGIAFGTALCLAIRSVVVASPPRLAACFLCVQIAWQLAVQAALAVHENADLGAALSVPGLSAFDGRMLLPGLVAGAVGGIGTWLAAAVAAPVLRSGRVAGLSLLVGAVAGLVLSLDSLLALFVIWQGGLAAVIGRAISSSTPEIAATLRS